jgi:catechol 2,3-dioxygenase-like lactoylglutathione lyase family enzyme
MISHFDHVVLTVANIDRAVTFYETVLKMESITFGEGRKAVRFGQQKINLQLLGEELRNHAMEGAGDLCLITDWSMEDVVAHLNKCKVAILEGPVSKSGAQGPIESVYFNDPDNNLIEVSVYSDNDSKDDGTEAENPEPEVSKAEDGNTEDEDVNVETNEIEESEVEESEVEESEVEYVETNVETNDIEESAVEENVSSESSEIEETKEKKPTN